MLALQQRHHLPPSPSSPSFEQLSQQLSAQQLYDQKLLHDYLESQQQTFANNAVVIDSQSNPFMTSAYDFANPAIRIQQSTPTPQTSTGFSPTPMLSTSGAATGLDNWNSYNNNVHGHQSLQTPVQSRSGRTHQRASSSSSIGSAGSQYQSVASTAAYQAFSNAPHHLPTPTHTPTQDGFMNSNSFSTYTPNTTTGMDSTMAAHMSMKQALMDQHVPDEEVPGFAHSARHSVSSYGHDSPATPLTAQGDDVDFKMPSNDMRQHTVPKFERTYTDVAADYSFDASSVSTTHPTSQSKQAANTLLSPYRSGNSNDIIQRSLQAAQMARSQSPSSSVSRGDSPFRRGSPYGHATNSFQSPRVPMASAAAAREHKAEADAAYAMKSQVSSREEAKTISPKDALLEYREADEESKVPLFPEGGANAYDHQYNGGDHYRNATQSTFDTTQQSYQGESWATPQFSASNFPTSGASTSQPSSTFTFATPAISSTNLQAMPFTSTSQYRSIPAMSAAPEQNPEFPAHLTSMESSASEADPGFGSQTSERLHKPADSKADSGTYTCTYHGCTQRFETPQKLQKHKREGHRNTTATGIGGGSSSPTSMTSAALLERNSQAGPHRCERINPTTGKPCSTIFSRPYDLTRHEDTIHNVRKQKVRCAMCVEEKTFSRNDALTRHMRVVHPEVDFPGKHRRRGGNHD